MSDSAIQLGYPNVNLKSHTSFLLKKVTTTTKDYKLCDTMLNTCIMAWCLYSWCSIDLWVCTCPCMCIMAMPGPCHNLHTSICCATEVYDTCQAQPAQKVGNQAHSMPLLLTKSINTGDSCLANDSLPPSAEMSLAIESYEICACFAGTACDSYRSLLVWPADLSAKSALMHTQGATY